jgi:hypothetical protein
MEFVIKHLSLHPTVNSSLLGPYTDRLCGLVVRVLGYRYGGPGSIHGTTRKKVMCLEWGPLSLVSTTEELLDRKVAAHVYKTDNMAKGIRHADHVAPSIRKSWQSLRRQAAVALSVQVARGLIPWSFFRVTYFLRITFSDNPDLGLSFKARYHPK